MSSLFDTVQELKTRAKNRRDLGRYQMCIDVLGEAIQLLRHELDTSEATERRSRIASELGDCYGMIGGAERRWALEHGSGTEDRSDHLIRSINAYDTGYYEFEGEETYVIADTYNLLNRLISRILYDPNALTDAENAEASAKIKPLNVRKELAEAAKVLVEQLRLRRRGDYWAMGDLALVELLLGRKEPRSAFAEFNSASPPGYAYESVIATLRMLSDSSISVSPLLQGAIKLLERHSL